MLVRIKYLKKNYTRVEIYVKGKGAVKFIDVPSVTNALKFDGTT